MIPTSITNIPVKSGFLLVNKPSGPTSYDMIRWIKRSVKNVKIGHCGTLDPIAEGLLIILLGKATREQSRYMGADKMYRCRARLGIKTDTGDITGKIIEQTESFSFPSESVLKETLQKFLGEQEQVPPMYSALKHEGTPLYKLARQGETIDRKPRSIIIHSIELTQTNPPDEFEFVVRSSSGTYVRTLVEDIGTRLGMPATMKGLIREAIGDFHVKDAVPGGKLRDVQESQLWEWVKPVF